MRNWPIACTVVCVTGRAPRSRAAWSGSHSTVRALQHGIISAAPLDRRPNLQHAAISQRLIIHAIVTHSLCADAGRLPNTASGEVALLDLLTSATTDSHSVTAKHDA